MPAKEQQSQQQISTVEEVQSDIAFGAKIMKQGQIILALNQEVNNLRMVVNQLTEDIKKLVIENENLKGKRK